MSRQRSRSSGGSQGMYLVWDNQLVDAKSKQLLQYEFNVTHLGKTVLKNGEWFSEADAHNLMSEHLRKRKGEGMCNFLVDRIRFAKKSGSRRGTRREYLTYREIRHVYRFNAQPSTFMLGVEEEPSGKRSYETFQCVSISDADDIVALIRQATADPQYLLRNHGIIHHVPSHMESSPPRVHYIQTTERHPSHIRDLGSEKVITVYPNHERSRSPRRDVSAIRIQPQPVQHQTHLSPVHIERSRDLSSAVGEPWMSGQPYHVIERTIKPTSVYLNQAEPSNNRVYSMSVLSNGYHGPVDHHVRADGVWSDKPPYSNGLMNPVDLMNKEDVTLLNANAPNGPEVSNHGSVYMFVSRSRRID